MSKNIDEIVSEILPDDYILGGASGIVQCCRGLLKQAITDKKLFVPMSEEAIKELVVVHCLACDTEVWDGKIDAFAKAIYEEQFKESV